MPDARVLKGQKALVTGGSSGIGAAICVAFARAGASRMFKRFLKEFGRIDVLVANAGIQKGATLYVDGGMTLYPGLIDNG